MWGVHLFGGWLILFVTLSPVEQQQIFLSLSNQIYSIAFCILFSLSLGSFLYSSFDMLMALYQLLPLHMAAAGAICFSVNNKASDYLKDAFIAENTVQANKQEKRIKVLSGRGFALIKLSEISLVTGAKNYLELTTNKGHFLLRQTMAEFEHKYSNTGFIRVHRSHIVNIEFIDKVASDLQGNNYLHIGDQLKIKLSQSYKDNFIELTSINE
jgi:DNA-binding LytR/AlgR family response regulator